MFGIFTFSKQAVDESLDVFNRHSLMKDINVVDICQAHLSVQFASNIDLSFAKSDTDIVIDSKPHSSYTYNTSLLFAPLAVRVPLFRFTLRQNC